MTLHILKPGLQTTIQDTGRPGNLHWGLSCGGAADTFATALGNRLLGNPDGHPCLEVTLTGPEIEFGEEISIAITGAHFDLFLNDTGIANDEVIQVCRGDRLRFGTLRSGARAYIALAGEIDIPATLGSRSTHVVAGIGGIQGRPLQVGDQIPLRPYQPAPRRKLPPQYRLDYRARPLLRVVPGLEENYFSAAAREQFYGGGFSVSSQSNRMGIRLAGEVLPVENIPQQISSALCPGTIQVPPNGQPIISFVEGQTIGGYPRIAHVIRADLHRLGQLAPGSRLDFERVDMDTAHRILQDKSRLLAELSESIGGVEYQ